MSMKPGGTSVALTSAPEAVSTPTTTRSSGVRKAVKKKAQGLAAGRG
jgi:hypothetical protein